MAGPEVPPGTGADEPEDPGGAQPDGRSIDPGTASGWPASSARRVRSPRGRGWSALKEFTVIVVGALVISALVRTFLLQAFWVPSGSMEETLVRGDRILVWKLGGEPARGEVVVFQDPSDWLADPVAPTGWRALATRVGVFLGVIPSSSGDDLVKRVIAVEGDTIECCSPDGRIVRNGEPIGEPYVRPGDRTDQIEFSVTVPPGRLFVMGDHRSDSADSRYHLDQQDGTVPVDNVVGRAVAVMWPIDRWATLPDYQGAG